MIYKKKVVFFPSILFHPTSDRSFIPVCKFCYFCLIFAKVFLKIADFISHNFSNKGKSIEIQ